MNEFLARSFEKACSVLAYVNIAIWLLGGIILGIGLKEQLYIRGFLGVVVVIGIALLGFLIGLVFDIVVFGFFAQITQIRKSLEKLASK